MDRRDVLKLTVEERRELLEAAASDPEVQACYAGPSEAEQNYLGRIAAIELAAYGYAGDLPEKYRHDPLVQRVQELRVAWLARFYTALAAQEMGKHIELLRPGRPNDETLLE